MEFLQLNKPLRQVPGYGPRTAKIVIVGDAPGSYEMAQLKPFVGPAGSVLEQCLHSAGLIRSEVYMTNVIKTQPKANKLEAYFNPANGQFTALGYESVEALRDELNELSPNVVVACGQAACAAICGTHKTLKYRGYFFESQGFAKTFKVMPTIHPSAALRGNYTYRYLIAADMKKAKNESLNPELTRPERQLVYNFQTVSEVLEWLDYFEQSPVVCFDIEVLNYELACIGFSSEPNIAVSIPLAGKWSLEDEALIWLGIQRVLGNPASTKVGQNLIFDNQFLLTRCAIEVRGPLEDTMIAHSIMFPELPKGLGFLGSIYCGTQAYWKDAVKFTNIKGEA